VTGLSVSVLVEHSDQGKVLPLDSVFTALFVVVVVDCLAPLVAAPLIVLVVVLDLEPPDVEPPVFVPVDLEPVLDDVE
jgi:hypothetical protein